MIRPVRVLELRSVLGTGGGPEKTILEGARQTRTDRAAVTVCYLRDARDGVFRIGDRATGLGIDYVELVERHSFDWRIWPALRQLVRDRGIEVVHAHEHKTDLLAWLLARRAGIVPLSTAHGWTGHSRRERLLYYPADKRVLRRYPLVLAVSTEVRDDLARHGVPPDRIRVLLNGVDHLVFRRDPDREAAARERFGLVPGELAIGAVGRLEPQKRFDLLIQAVAAVRDRAPGLKLLIAGEGSARPLLEAEIRRCGAGAWCTLTGQLEDVRDLHHALDLFVQSSVYEGTPNVVLEAMAMTTPVLATRAGGTAELVREEVDGLLVPPGDADALTGALRRALADPEGCRRRAASARRRVETDLSFERRVRTLEDIYAGLVRRRIR